MADATQESGDLDAAAGGRRRGLGLGPQPAALYAAVGGGPPAGRRERLPREHSPMPARIERLTCSG